MSKKTPVNKNETYVVKIEAMGHEGQGIARIDGYTVFIENALIGDTAEVLIVKANKNFGYGKLMNILSPSEERINPTCTITRCGGCQLQHMSYTGQLAFKTKVVEDAICKIGNLKEIPVHHCLGMDEPFHYRNKAQFPVKEKDGVIQIGFYAKRSHDIIEGEGCSIQDPINEKIVNIVRDYMTAYQVSAYNEINHTGLIRHVLVRRAFTTGEIMVCIITNGNKLPHADALVTALQKVEGVCSIVQNINTKKSNVILGEQVKHLSGKEKIIDYIGGIAFEISALSFFQVNPIQTEVLYKKALDYAQLEGNETVVDAYCGIGTISLFLAQKAKKVIGIEVVPQAIQDAKRNAELNDITNTEFYVGESEVVMPKLYQEGLRADVIVVDPPRKGCDEAFLETVAAMEPNRIVYVSCNPSTLARDLKFLDEKGYKTVEVQPVDMFPMTYHVECVVLMSRVDK